LASAVPQTAPSLRENFAQAVRALITTFVATIIWSVDTITSI